MKRQSRQVKQGNSCNCWTVGSHDGVLVLSADKEGKILHLLSELASRGYVRTESMRAFTDAEFDAVLKA